MIFWFMLGSLFLSGSRGGGNSQEFCGGEGACLAGGGGGRAVAVESCGASAGERGAARFDAGGGGGIVALAGLAVDRLPAERGVSGGPDPLAWSRKREYLLGFGPFPIIFSINLFLWFRDDWFYLQYLMLAAGFMGKEYVRWMRDGRNVHIFNPSAFALGLFSLALIVTGTTELTWGQEIASTLTLAPNIYLFLFLAGLVVMYFFSITLVAGMAAISLFVMSALYFALTGVPYFIDSEIPAAVFLGLHLLVTDPSTSPRTPLGKALFGVLYGLGVFGLYTLLGALGAPTFYDKLLCASFAGKTDSRHTGDSIPFWEQACAESLPNACGRLLQLQATYCGDNSAWACNELGAHYREGRIIDADAELALGFFSRACELKSMAACRNLLRADALYRPPPGDLDLRLLLREGGLNLMEMPPADLYRRACEHDWRFACEERRS